MENNKQVAESEQRAKVNMADLQMAKAELATGENTCVLVKSGKVVHKAAGIGISPLMRLYETSEGRLALKGAFVADTIIGKGAAVLLVLAEITAIHGEVMSRSACEYLNKYKIPFTYTTFTETIQNRKKDGICPIEKSVLAIENPQEGYIALQKTIAILMADK